MSNRFPSITKLSNLSANDRSFTIERFRSEIEAEFDGIQSGHITPWNGTTKAQLKAANRARLKRVEVAVARFGI